MLLKCKPVISTTEAFQTTPASLFNLRSHLHKSSDTTLILGISTGIVLYTCTNQSGYGTQRFNARK